MIGVTNNSPQQINAALIALKGEVKNEVKNEIIEETKIKQIESDVIDDNVISQDKTWSSDKISSMLGTTYPEGYVYQQLYFPAVTIGGKSYSAGWGKTPAELGMTPASGCKWEEFTKAFTDAGKQYLKIMNNTSQSGHNAYHRHSHDHAHIHSHIAYTGCYSTKNEAGGYGLGGQPGFQNRVMVSAPSNVGTSTDSTGPSSWNGSQWFSNIYTSYNGNSSEQTVEVNASGMKIWKVVADT